MAQGKKSNNLKLFNRGRLLNIGYKIAISHGCDYVSFHDVDMLPEEANYLYPTKPTHLASQLSNYNYGKKIVLDLIKCIFVTVRCASQLWHWG